MFSIVTSRLGVLGWLLLQQVLQLIPSNFMNYQIDYIHDILETALKLDIQKSELKVIIDTCCKFDESLKNAVGMPLQEVLWEATFKHGQARMLFLAPPTNFCLRCGSLLSTHNKPTTVICYTQNGPLPAMKIILRCDKCGTNYRYVRNYNIRQKFL